MSERTRVLLFGYGVIGGSIADLLLQMGNDFALVVAGRSYEGLRDRCNLAMAVALNLGLKPELEIRRCDVSNIDQTAELIAAVAPEIIINTTSLQTFWQISTLPKPVYVDLARACVGPWLPNHLATAYALMRAVQASQSAAKIVNAAFPDAVNPVLHRAGLGPYAGGGNLANLVPSLRRAIAKLLTANLEDVSVRFVAHHVVGNAIATDGSANGAPYLLRAYVSGADVTRDVSPEQIFPLFTTELKRTRGVKGQVMAASGVAIVVRAMTRAEPEVVHVPGPRGLIGGYPARISRSGLTIELPPDITTEEAIAVNERGQQFEGIEHIDDNGTVHFVEENMSVLTKAFGYRCKSMKLSEVGLWAQELQTKYRAFTRAL